MYDTSNYNFTKGDIGEEIGRRFLERKGYILYAPMKKEAHPFDRIAIKWDMKPMALDFKTYPSRLYYPDTGINYNHYLKYKEYPHDFYIFFIDEIRKKMYGNKFSELLKTITIANNIYPLIQSGKKGKKIYFPLDNMELYATLSPQTCKKLEKVSNSKHYVVNKTPKKFNIKWKENKSWIK